MSIGSAGYDFPPLPINEWEETKNTFHLFLQVVGKIRLYTFPKKNHWWHVPFYVSARGLTTGPIPYKGQDFEMEFDLIDHALTIRVSDGLLQPIPLKGLSVASLYRQVLFALASDGIEVEYRQPYPFDLPFSTIPFEEDREHDVYDPEYVHRFWAILRQVDTIFQKFRGRFTGKSTPPHLFWHHMDLALTRFSGKRAPEKESAGVVEREAYSHENISFGFWAGDENIRAPAFYGYCFDDVRRHQELVESRGKDPGLSRKCLPGWCEKGRMGH
jgi:hypothetical protein